MPKFFAKNTSECVSISRKARNRGNLSAKIFLVKTIIANIIDNSKGDVLYFFRLSLDTKTKKRIQYNQKFIRNEKQICAIVKDKKSS